MIVVVNSGDIFGLVAIRMKYTSDFESIDSVSKVSRHFVQLW